MTTPTPYPEVNVILTELLSQIRSIFGDQFIGMYLGGSLAAGDFSLETSDIDFVAVVAESLSPESVQALDAMHRRLSAGESKWGYELEGSYVARETIRRYDPDHAPFPHIERGETLQVEKHATDWLIQCHIVREKGITIAGPPPETLIDPIPQKMVRLAVIELFDNWWAPMIENDQKLQHPGYQSYAVTTMCRMLYTLHHGTVASKPTAARWTRKYHDPHWIPLIDRAETWTLTEDDVAETQMLIGYVKEQIEQNEGRLE